MKTLFQMSIKRMCREQYKGEHQEKDLRWIVSSSEGTEELHTLTTVLAVLAELLPRLERIRNGE